VSATPATKALDKAKVAYTTHAYRHDPKHESFGLEAAEQLNLDPAVVFKTLVASVDGELTVAIVPVERQLDLKALAAARQAKKAQMADVKQAERTTGYVAGGISPLGQRKALPTVIDASAAEHPTIHVSGGRR
jgi:Cys-tRNA(Pro)/Cys-tRNA(Cys) deacylase